MTTVLCKSYNASQFFCKNFFRAIEKKFYTYVWSAVQSTWSWLSFFNGVSLKKKKKFICFPQILILGTNLVDLISKNTNDETTFFYRQTLPSLSSPRTLQIAMDWWEQDFRTRAEMERPRKAIESQKLCNPQQKQNAMKNRKEAPLTKHYQGRWSRNYKKPALRINTLLDQIGQPGG